MGSKKNAIAEIVDAVADTDGYRVVWNKHDAATGVIYGPPGTDPVKFSTRIHDGVHGPKNFQATLRQRLHWTPTVLADQILKDRRKRSAEHDRKAEEKMQAAVAATTAPAFSHVPGAAPAIGVRAETPQQSPPAERDGESVTAGVRRVLREAEGPMSPQEVAAALGRRGVSGDIRTALRAVPQRNTEASQPPGGGKLPKLYADTVDKLRKRHRVEIENPPKARQATKKRAAKKTAASKATPAPEPEPAPAPEPEPAVAEPQPRGPEVFENSFTALRDGGMIIYDDSGEPWIAYRLVRAAAVA